MVDTEFSKYRLIAEIGHGGMADVFLAAMGGPADFRKLVVIKRLRANVNDDTEFVSMLLDEARIAARLNHPNVVQTLEVGQFEGQYFLVMEHLEGQPLHRLQQRLARDGSRIPAPTLYRIIADVLGGLHYAHKLNDYDGTPLGIVHRDVSPHNIFTTYDGLVKIMDFGIAKAAGRTTETRTGIIKGKVTYMAPEQALAKDVDARADIFSSGAMLWEAASGRRLWGGASDVVIMTRLIDGNIPRSPRAVEPSVPEAIDRICRKALAPDRADRYATAAELQADIEEYLEKIGERVTSREIGNLVASKFAAQRAELRAIVERQLRIPLSAPPQNLASSIMVSESVSNLSMAPSITDQVEPPMRGGVPQPDDDDQTKLVGRSRKFGRRVASVVPVLAMAGAVAWLASTQGTESSSEQPFSAEAPGTSPIQENVIIEVRASPASARFLLDGKWLNENPFQAAVAKDDADHTLLVEAPGFTAQQRSLKFTRDVFLEMTLLPEPAPASSAEATHPSAGRSPAHQGRAPPPPTTQSDRTSRAPRTIEKAWPK